MTGSLPLPRPRRRPVRVPAARELATALTGLTVEFGCVIGALAVTPATPPWLVAALWAGTLGGATVTVWALRRAVSGRPRSARHHGSITFKGGAHRAAPPTGRSQP